VSTSWAISGWTRDVAKDAHPVDTGNFEPERTASKVSPVEIVAHHQDDVQQLAEQLGIAKIIASGREQVQALIHEHNTPKIIFASPATANPDSAQS
jgi:hypothetical protein